MAIRNTQLVLKNSNIPNKPFSGGTFLQGEAFVNTADGILMFSGNTQSTSEWTPAGTGGNANFFEVGSNLYDLQLRNRLTKYEGVSGSGLTGKFLSGTTNGFVLADITSIAGVDTYVTGFTYQDNVFTIKQNYGQPNLTAVINTMTGLTVNGDLSVTGNTLMVGTLNVTGDTRFNNITATTISATTYQNLPTDIRVTGATYLNNTFTYTNNTGGTFNTSFNVVTGLTVNGILSATTISGDTIYANSFPQLPYTDDETIEIYTDISGNTLVRVKEIVSAPSGGTRTFLGNINISSGLTVTGNTSLQGLTATTVSATTYLNLPLDIYVTGGTYSSDVATFTNNTGGTFNVSGFSSSFTGGTVTGATNFTNGLTANTISATTYYNLPIDVYVTGATYSDNTFTYGNNTGGTFNVSFDTVTGLTVNGVLSATTANLETINVNDLTITGTATYNKTATGSTELVNYGTLTAFTQTSDVYVTGNTLTAANNDTNTQSAQLDYHGTPIGGPHFITTQNTFTTGGTYSNSTKLVTFKRNDGTTGYTVDLSTLDTNDTYVTGGTITTAPSNNSINGTIGLLYNQDVAPGTYTLPFSDVFTTGFTYNSTNNTLTLKDNSGNTFNQAINTVSGLTFSNLTAGRVVYVGSGGLLTDENGFTYDAGTNTFSVPTDGTVNVGTGGLNVAGDAVVQGSLTVFGPSVSAFTSNLYVEDPNITLNYNPTGSTTITSVGAGWTIQDGSGIANTATTLNIGVSYLNANLSPNTEYTAATGNENRNFYSPIGDIIIRNTNGDSSAPNGVRLLAEGDILSGGSY